MTHRQIVMTTNNATDHLLLVVDAVVASEWQVTRETLADYLRDGAQPDLWDDQGLALEGRDPESYGEIVGRDGAVDDQRRRAFWGLDESQ